eukprot:767060-Hanusia_phi.AAC.4
MYLGSQASRAMVLVLLPTHGPLDRNLTLVHLALARLILEPVNLLLEQFVRAQVGGREERRRDVRGSKSSAGYGDELRGNEKLWAGLTAKWHYQPRGSVRAGPGRAAAVYSVSPTAKADSPGCTTRGRLTEYAWAAPVALPRASSEPECEPVGAARDSPGSPLRAPSFKFCDDGSVVRSSVGALGVSLQLGKLSAWQLTAGDRD